MSKPKVLLPPFLTTVYLTGEFGWLAVFSLLHSDERNFHIFYYLFAMPNKERFFLDKISSFPYAFSTLTRSLRSALGGQLWDDNAAMAVEVVQTLELLGFTEEVCRPAARADIPGQGDVVQGPCGRAPSDKHQL